MAIKLQYFNANITKYAFLEQFEWRGEIPTVFFHASEDAKFALATLGNDAGMYGAVKMVLD